MQDVQACQYGNGLCYRDVTMARWLVQIWSTSTHSPQAPPSQIQNTTQQESLKSRVFPGETGILYTLISYILKHFSFFYWNPLSLIQRSRVTELWQNLIQKLDVIWEKFVGVLRSSAMLIFTVGK